MKKQNIIASVDRGYISPPGGPYSVRKAEISQRLRGGYELRLRYSSGSNQGYLEEHHSWTTRHRADTLRDFLFVTLSGAPEHAQSDFADAIREAVYDAEDAEAEGDAEAGDE